MKIVTKTKYLLVGLVLLGSAAASVAVTLGRARGAVLVGQALNVSVLVQGDPGDGSSLPCLEADVVLGDNRLMPGEVRVQSEPAAQADAINVRISTLRAVDEAVVSLELRVGCNQRASRRYVFLSDVPTEQADSPVALPRVPFGPGPGLSTRDNSVAVQPVSPPVPTSAVSSRPGQAAKVPRAARPARVTVAQGEGLTASARPAPAGGSKVSQAGRKDTGKSRLRLDPAELLVERDPVLKATPEIAAVPAEAPAVRASAASLWWAVNVPVEEVVKDQQKLKGLEADVRSLRTLVEKNQRTLADLRAQLQQAQDERVDPVWLYGLAAALLAAVAAAVFFWRRRAVPETGAWWQGSTMEPKGSQFGAEAGFVPTGGGSSVPANSKLPDGNEVDIDLDLDESMFDSLRNAVMPVQAVIAEVEQRNRKLAPAAPGSPTGGPDFLPSVPGMRSASAEELFDIRQQAEFFTSLGQYDQAIQVLESCIGDSGEASPHVYLDLLKLFHTLNRKADFERYRSLFNRLFTGRIAEFAAFNDEGRGLEEYGELFARITKLWLTVEVVDLIEVFIFRNPGGDHSQGFDLAAYRDLLLLHSIAKRLLGASAGFVDSNNAALTRNPFKSSADLTALGMTTGPGPLEPVMADVAPQGLDLDLSLPDEPASPQAAAPEGGSTPLEFPPVDAVPSAFSEITAPTAVVKPAQGNLIDFDFDLPEPKKPV